MASPALVAAVDEALWHPGLEEGELQRLCAVFRLEKPPTDTAELLRHMLESAESDRIALLRCEGTFERLRALMVQARE